MALTRDSDARCLAAAGHGHDGSHRLSASRSQAAPGRSRPCRCCCSVFSPMSLRKTLSWTSWESPSAPRAALSCPRVVKGHAPTELRHWNGGRDPPQPPSSSSNGENAQKEGETNGGQWRRLLVRSTNRSRSRPFARLFFFLSHPLTTSRLCRGGDLAKTGVAFFRRPSRGFCSIGAWRPRAPVGDWLSVGRLIVWRRSLGVSKGDRGENQGFSR